MLSTFLFLVLFDYYEYMDYLTKLENNKINMKLTIIR